jgi:hypothetical protein
VEHTLLLLVVVVLEMSMVLQVAMAATPLYLLLGLPLLAEVEAQDTRLVKIMQGKAVVLVVAVPMIIAQDLLDPEHLVKAMQVPTQITLRVVLALNG